MVGGKSLKNRGKVGEPTPDPALMYARAALCAVERKDGQTDEDGRTDCPLLQIAQCHNITTEIENEAPVNSAVGPVLRHSVFSLHPIIGS